ncbi:hypothetical protein BHM03_00028124 [Ensete ventricosum]|nr:hypothetical protein BHM03_00028124 [Ensete ventricosum]
MCSMPSVEEKSPCLFVWAPFRLPSERYARAYGVVRIYIYIIKNLKRRRTLSKQHHLLFSLPHLWASAKKATKTSKAVDVSGLRQRTRQRSRRVAGEAMKETASSIALAIASPLPLGSRSSREGGAGSRCVKSKSIITDLFRAVDRNFDHYRINSPISISSGPPGSERSTYRFTGGSTARYRAVPPKIDRQRSIEGRNPPPMVN